MSKDTAAIRDQLGNDPDTTFLLDADYYESVGVEEGATIVKTRDITNTWVVGSSTNAIVGEWTGTIGGKQLVVGKDDRDIVVIRVVNPNDIFREHFRDTTFQDGDASNTADWNTTLFRLAMTTETAKDTAYNTIATSNTIFTDSKTITKATFNTTETKYGNDVIKYFLSADGGNTWEEVTLGTEHIFNTTGTNLKFRVIFIGNGANDTYIEDINIRYSAS